MATQQKKNAPKASNPSSKRPSSTQRKASVKPKVTRAKAPKPKPQEAINSAEFQQAKSKAEEYIRDPEKTNGLLDEAIKKAKGKNKGPLTEVWRYITALIRLVRAYVQGNYKDVPWQTIVLATAGLIYFVSPIDLIPDAIPIVGFLDDAAIISFVVASIKLDLDNFLEWENDQRL